MTLEQLILEKLDDLCTRITKLEEKVDNHLKDRMNQKKTNREIILIVITIISTSAAVYGVLT